MLKRTRTTEQVVAGLVLSFLALLSIIPTAYAQFAAAATTSNTTIIATKTSSAAAPAPTNGTTTTPVVANGAPSAFLGVASTTGDGVVFYHGGQLNLPTVQYSSDLISLDVKTSWSISSPAWTNLTIPASGSGGPTVGSHSATMSADRSTLYLTGPSGNPSSPFLYEYNINARTWSTDNAPAAQAVAWSTRKKAMFMTDDTTGAIWYIGGTSTDGTDSNEIDEFQSGSWNANLGTTAISTSAAGKSAAVMSKFSSGTAHILDSKIYIFGGFSSVSGARSYQSFQSLPLIDVSTATPAIGTQLTLGNVPPSRQEHCSVLTASKKIIIFGGYDANAKSTFSDIWSLDLVTMIWQQITPVNPSRPRYGHNCNLVGANMIVYGGRTSGTGNSTGTGYGQDTQVYDIMQSTWMSTYTPKEDTTAISQPLGDGVGSNGSKSKLSTGALVGIVVGALVVVICAIGAFVYRKRQRRIEIREAEIEKEAYLASLGAEGDEGVNRKRSQYRGHRNNPYSASSPNSASTRRLNIASPLTNTPGMSTYGNSGPESPTSREYDHELSYTGETPGNVQYLMQQLPDGTIAVQPVYLDHQPRHLQHSPNMIYSETSSLSGFLGTSMTPTTANANLPGGVGSASPAPYFMPPPPVHNNGKVGSSLSPGYVLPPSINTNRDAGATTHDPFASPVLTQFQAQWLQSSPSSSPKSQSRVSQRGQ